MVDFGDGTKADKVLDKVEEGGDVGHGSHRIECHAILHQSSFVVICRRD